MQLTSHSVRNKLVAVEYAGLVIGEGGNASESLDQILCFRQGDVGYRWGLGALPPAAGQVLTLFSEN